MKKLISLIKASMTENMELFRVRNKNQSNASKKIFPIVLFCFLFFMMWVYANTIMEKLDAVNAEYVGLSIFVILTTVITIIEGVYKSSSLLFNCKDDNLMFSLPIKKGTVLFVRMFKFYVFELIYNSMFLLPAMVAYIRWGNISWTYYLVSILALIIFPIIPIALSCIIGMIISFISTKFKRKNIVQIIVTTVFLVVIFAISFNSNGLLNKIVENATSINDIITKIYFPAGQYIDLITNFNILNLLIFIGSNLAIGVITVLLLSKVYFKINSNVKKVSSKKSNSQYKIKTSSKTFALIKKEWKKFITSPVFITNAGFGLVLFLLGCILAAIKFDSFAIPLTTEGQIDIGTIKSYIPLALLSFIIVSSLMTSITSSMISLEGKKINLLKSLPIKPYTIIQSKVLSAILIMIPVFLIGDIIIIARFGCSIFQAIMILIGSIVLPLVSETIGIIINLKYPKMDASSDTEVVKQSLSSTIAVFAGMGLIGVTAFGIYSLFARSVHSDIIMAVVLGVYILIYLVLWIYLKKTSVKRFNEINT